ncbi:MAG: hypothetical protein MJ247_04775 [Alphaproteobacteria bacterium]|nr:hypothetical protein [Alphaproteobacteria bacterium]
MHFKSSFVLTPIILGMLFSSVPGYSFAKEDAKNVEMNKQKTTKNKTWFYTPELFKKFGSYTNKRDEMIEKLKKYSLPVNVEEYRLNTLFWNDDVAADEFSWKEQNDENVKDIEFMSDFAMIAIPDPGKVSGNFVKEIDEADLMATNLFVTYESTKSIQKDLEELSDFFTNIEGNGVINFYYDQIGRFNKRIDAKTENIVLTSPKDLQVFDNNTQTESAFVKNIETTEKQAIISFDDAIYSFLLDDVSDLAYSLDISSNDLALWEKDNLLVDKKLDFYNYKKEISGNFNRLKTILNNYSKYLYDNEKQHQEDKIGIEWFFRQGKNDE